jgi:hypothetical protein
MAGEEGNRSESLAGFTDFMTESLVVPDRMEINHKYKFKWKFIVFLQYLKFLTNWRDN